MPLSLEPHRGMIYICGFIHAFCRRRQVYGYICFPFSARMCHISPASFILLLGNKFNCYEEGPKKNPQKTTNKTHTKKQCTSIRYSMLNHALDSDIYYLILFPTINPLENIVQTSGHHQRTKNKALLFRIYGMGPGRGGSVS